MTLPDVGSLAQYGGVKVNDHPVVDPQTDLDADEDNKARCDVAAMTHVAPRAWCRFTTAATTGAMILVSHDSNWGSLGGVAPTLSRISAGVFDVTWPTTVTDELGVSHTLNIRWAWPPNHRAITAILTNAIPQASNRVRVYVRDNTLAVADIAGTDIDLVVG